MDEMDEKQEAASRILEAIGTIKISNSKNQNKINRMAEYIIEFEFCLYKDTDEKAIKKAEKLLKKLGKLGVENTELKGVYKRYFGQLSEATKIV